MPLKLTKKSDRGKHSLQQRESLLCGILIHLWVGIEYGRNDLHFNRQKTPRFTFEWCDEITKEIVNILRFDKISLIYNQGWITHQIQTMSK